MLLAAVAVLLAAGAALLASGVGTLVVGGDKGGASARAAQQPLGRFVVGGDKRGEGGSGANEVPGDVGGKRPGGPSSGGFGGSGVGIGDSAGGGSSLPFTAFLAVPVLLAGAGLLLGASVRRRPGRAASWARRALPGTEGDWRT